MPTLAVFFGGVSNECEISVITGMYAVNLLRGSRYRAIPVYLPPEGGMVTGDFRSVADFSAAGGVRAVRVVLQGRALVRPGRRRPVAEIDAALNCCHGGMGEDGTLAALLAWNGIPSASPAAAASGVFMDKALGKIAAQGLGIATAPSFFLTEEAWRRDRAEALARAEAFGYPVVVKPVTLGSSIGVGVARNADEAERALALAFTLDGGALVERYFARKRDINCAAVRRDGEVIVSPCEEVLSGGALLSFSDKYEKDAARVFPARLTEEERTAVQGATRRLYEAFRMNGVVRADFLATEEGVFFSELNMVPGSLAAYLFSDSLAQARRFLLALADEALASSPRAKPTVHTGILEKGIFSRGKGCKRRGNFV